MGLGWEWGSGMMGVVGIRLKPTLEQGVEDRPGGGGGLAGVSAWCVP